MALIDEIGKDESKKNIDHKCNNCKIDLPLTIDVDICENCFNNKVEETLTNIKNVINKINLELEKLATNINKIKHELNNPKLHIVIINKLNIDLLNFESIYKKLLIDLDTNKKGYELNQVQANNFRKYNKWKIKEMIQLENK